MVEAKAEDATNYDFQGGTTVKVECQTDVIEILSARAFDFFYMSRIDWQCLGRTWMWISNQKSVDWLNVIYFFGKIDELSLNLSTLKFNRAP